MTTLSFGKKDNLCIDACCDTECYPIDPMLVDKLVSSAELNGDIDRSLRPQALKDYFFSNFRYNLSTDYHLAMARLEAAHPKIYSCLMKFGFTEHKYK